jgi:hypothetical protein
LELSQKSCGAVVRELLFRTFIHLPKRRATAELRNRSGVPSYATSGRLLMKIGLKAVRGNADASSSCGRGPAVFDPVWRKVRARISLRMGLMMPLKPVSLRVWILSHGRV